MTRLSVVGSTPEGIALSWQRSREEPQSDCRFASVEKLPPVTGTAAARTETERPLRQSMSTAVTSKEAVPEIATVSAVMSVFGSTDTLKNAGSAGVVMAEVVSGPGTAVAGVATRPPTSRLARNTGIALDLQLI